MKTYLCFLSCIWHLFKEASHCGEILHSLQTTKEHRYKEGSTNRRAKGPRVWFLKWLLYPVGHREMFTKKQRNQSRNAHFCDILGGFIPGNREKQAWGQRLQNALTIIPGDCQRFVNYHWDPVHNQLLITKYQKLALS